MQVNMKFLRSHCDFFFLDNPSIEKEKRKDKIIKKEYLWIKFETNMKQIRDEIKKDIWYNLFVTNLDKLPQINKKAGNNNW